MFYALLADFPECISRTKRESIRWAGCSIQKLRHQSSGGSRYPVHMEGRESCLNIAFCPQKQGALNGSRLVQWFWGFGELLKIPMPKSLPGPFYSEPLGARHQLQHFLKLLREGNMWSFPGGSVVKNLPAKAEDAGSIPGSHLYICTWLLGKTISLTIWTLLINWCLCFLICCLGLS